MPQKSAFIPFVLATVMLVLALGPAVMASQPDKPRPSDGANRWPMAGEPQATLNELGYEFHSDDVSPMTGGAGCRFEKWVLSGGRMALWHDGAVGAMDFDIAIQSPSAFEPRVKADGATDTVRSSSVEACAAVHQASPAVAPGEDEPPLATFDVEALDLWFSPAELTVSSLGSLTIRLENAGRVVHNLTVDELGIEIVVTRGSRGEVILTDAKPGTYTFYCSISGHREAGMEGTLIIQ